MKRLVIIASATLGLSAAASATNFTCSPMNQNIISSGNVNSPQLVTCAGVTASPGTYIIGIKVAIFGTFNDTVDDTIHQLQFTATDQTYGATVTASTNANDYIGSTGFSPGGVVAIVGSPVSLGDISVLVSVVSLLPDLPANASFTASIITQEAFVAPEPSTFGLLGLAFTALGAYARRKKA